MYLGKNNRFLTEAILLSVILGMVADASNLFVRLYERTRGSLIPDMLNDNLWNLQNIISAIQIFFTAIIFIFFCTKVTSMISRVSPEDRKQMGVLQEQEIGRDLPALEAGDIHKLLEIWGMILVGVQIGYQASSILYRRFIDRLADALGTGRGSETFVSLYNDTHGFKYIGMLIALLLGVAITGIFLNDRFLKVFSILYAGLFIIAFGVLNMDSFEIMGKTVGIVWTSILYHIIELGGMLMLVMYLRRRYPGV